MVKKLYFDKTWQLNSHLTIEIINGKIRKSNGGNYTPAILFGGRVKREVFELKSDFTLEKVHRYDRKKSGIAANYKIECGELFNRLIKPCYIRLNPIEKFIIDYSKKESFIQKAEIKKMIIVSAFVSIFVTIPTSLITNLLSNQNKTERINENKSVVKTDTTAVTKAKTK